MESLRGKVHVRAVVMASAAMIASIFVFGMIADRAGSQGATDHSDLEHHHGFTGPGAAADWPPRPTGAPALGAVLDNDALSEPIAAVFDVPQLTDDQVAAGGGGILGFEADPSPAQSDDPLAIALGADWVRVSYEEAKAGKDDITPAQETYFSRSNNQTVIVVQWPGATEILTFPAHDVQPIVSPQERDEATELGRQWLVAQGMTQVEALEGFAIRAFDGGELYPVRMVYVTYAPSWFDDPVLMALVDMTNLVVVEGGPL